MQSNYYSIIPAPIREADISPRAKLLFGEIVALTQSTGVCWATNEYFADLFKVSNRTISREVNLLARAGFLTITYTPKGVRQICHTMTPLSRGVDKSVQGGRQICPTPPSDGSNTKDDLKYNNTKVDPKTNNKRNIKEKERELRENFPDKAILFDEWLDYRRTVKRKPMNDLEGVAGEFLKYSIPEIRAAIDVSIQNEYLGLFIKKLKSKNGLTRNIADRLREKRHTDLSH